MYTLLCASPSLSLLAGRNVQLALMCVLFCVVHCGVQGVRQSHELWYDYDDCITLCCAPHCRRRRWNIVWTDTNYKRIKNRTWFKPFGIHSFQGKENARSETFCISSYHTKCTKVVEKSMKLHLSSSSISINSIWEWAADGLCAQCSHVKRTVLKTIATTSTSCVRTVKESRWNKVWVLKCDKIISFRIFYVFNSIEHFMLIYSSTLASIHAHTQTGLYPPYGHRYAQVVVTECWMHKM